jgi:hypothetical protein
VFSGTAIAIIFQRDDDYLCITAIAEVLSDMDAELAALEQCHAKTHPVKQGICRND